MERLIRSLSERPEPFAPGEESIWTDPHVAPQMLATHLDPETDLASRRPERIVSEVDWLVGTLGLQPGDRVLDLGCGPGLYCEALARRGFGVTGVDQSAGSLEHARHSAAAAGLEIEYVEADYRKLDLAGPFDAAILVYLDFGVLSETDRRATLAHVRDALRPGGRLAFDVQGAAAARPESTSWQVSAGAGFWRPGPHLVLERQLDYPEARVHGTEYAVLDESGDATVYRVWEQRYTRAALEQLLGECGFETERVAGDLAGNPWSPTSETLAAVARRR